MAKTTISGKLAKVMYGSVKISGMGTWTLSGYKKQVLENTEFGDTIQSFQFGGADDPGEVSFSGNYDPADTNGQTSFATAVKAGTEFSNLYFYETATRYWAVAAGGTILGTKCDAIVMERNSLGKIDFTGKVSGAAMTAYGT